jgi:hypothetical protein
VIRGAGAGRFVSKCWGYLDQDPSLFCLDERCSHQEVMGDGGLIRLCWNREGLADLPVSKIESPF